MQKENNFNKTKMTEQFYKSHTSKYFDGRKAKLLKTIKNRGGDIFRKGSVVILDGKRKVMTSYLTCTGGFGITKTRKRKNGCVISIRGISWEDVELM